MRRLVQFFIGSSIVFLAILSVFNLALFLETAKLAESGLDGSFMVEDVFPRLWSAFAVVGVLFLVHFVMSAIIAAVYWFCWRPPRKNRVQASDEQPTPQPGALFGEPRPLSPFYAALFAFVVLFPVISRGIVGSFNDLRSFLEQRIAPTPTLESDPSSKNATPLPDVPTPAATSEESKSPEEPSESSGAN